MEEERISSPPAHRVSLRTRRRIVLVFVATFLVLAPAIILYSMGYRYEWGKRRLEPTGLLRIEGTPPDAIVRVDGVIRAQRLPAWIDGLPGNAYDITIERDGFRPFTRRAAITGGRTTSLAGIHLFPIATPTLLHPAAIPTWSVSTDQRWAAFVQRRDAFQELWFLDLRTGTSTLALRLPATDRHRVSLTWSPRNATLLAAWGSDATQQIITLTPSNPGRPFAVTSLLPAPGANVTWELGNDAALIAAIDDRLFRVTLRTERVTPLRVPVPSGPFGVAKNTVYSIREHTLVAQSLDGGNVRTVAAFPRAVATFTDLRGAMLIATTVAPVPEELRIDTSNGTVALLAGHRSIGDLHRSPSTIRWSQTEVWLAGTERGHGELLTRRAAPIVDVRWVPDGTHALIATATDVTAIAVDPTIPATAVELATFDTITGMAPAIDGTLLYVNGRRGDQEGIWTFPLR